MLMGMNSPRMNAPPSMPLPMLAQALLWIRRPIEVLEYCRKHYGPTFTLKLPPFNVVLLTDPDAIRTVFASKGDDMHAGEVNRILRALVGDHSVLLLDGREHMRHRKLLMPSFHGERMRFYGETMAEITRASIATWPKHGEFSLHEYTQEITLQIILRTVFGADEGEQLGKLSEQIKLMLAAGESPFSVALMAALSTDVTRETRRPWKWLLRQRNRTDKLLYAQIAARRAEGSSDRRDVLAMMLQARDEDGQGMTDVEVRDELMTALAAGHETTATALAWAFERLLSNPSVLARLTQEVDDAGGKDASPDKLAALPYLDATIKEVLRLRPVIPMVGRVLKKDYTIGGYDLPAGSTVAACIYLAQRNPDVFPDPDAFKPERFLEGQPDPTTWLPFGGGIRRCIGAAFALYEMKIVLATILTHTELQLAQTAPLRIRRRAITLWPEGGTLVRQQST